MEGEGQVEPSAPQFPTLPWRLVPLTLGHRLPQCSGGADMGTVPPPAGDGPKPLVGARPRPGVPCAAAAFASLRCTTWRQRPPEETWFSTGLGTPAPSRTGAEVGEGGHPTRRDQAPPSPEGRPAPWGGTAGLRGRREGCSAHRSGGPRPRVFALGQWVAVGGGGAGPLN